MTYQFPFCRAQNNADNRRLKVETRKLQDALIQAKNNNKKVTTKKRESLESNHQNKTDGSGGELLVSTNDAVKLNHDIGQLKETIKNLEEKIQVRAKQRLYFFYKNSKNSKSPNFSNKNTNNPIIRPTIKI